MSRRRRSTSPEPVSHSRRSRSLSSTGAPDLLVDEAGHQCALHLAQRVEPLLRRQRRQQFDCLLDRRGRAPPGRPRRHWRRTCWSHRQRLVTGWSRVRRIGHPPRLLSDATRRRRRAARAGARRKAARPRPLLRHHRDELVGAHLQRPRQVAQRRGRRQPVAGLELGHVGIGQARSPRPARAGSCRGPRGGRGSAPPAPRCRSSCSSPCLCSLHNVRPLHYALLTA